MSRGPRRFHGDAVYVRCRLCGRSDRPRTGLDRGVCEVFRCLEPGGMFALYDWCLSVRYEESNAGHDDIKRRIVEGNGLIDIGTTQFQAAIRRAVSI
jgi:hypothetical protein